MLVWTSYQTDTGRIYPFLPVSIAQIGESRTDINLLTLLPINNYREIKTGCSVPGLIPRSIKLYLSDDSSYQLNYPEPFSQALFNSLTTAINVRSFELIGEQIKYSRLIKMLNNGS